MRDRPSTPVSTEPFAHGPSGTLESPDWPPLTLEEIDSLLRLYPEAGRTLCLKTVSPRPFSAASVVQTSRCELFVKRHPQAVRSRAGLIEEHHLLQYLAETRWPAGYPMVQAPLRAINGATVQVLGEWTYEVHPVAHGADLYRDAHSWTPFLSVEHAQAAGRALASLHLAAGNYAAPARKAQPLIASWTIFAANDPSSAMQSYLQQRPVLEAYAEERHWRESMREMLLPWHQRLRELQPHLKPIWTHNDFHASNLMWAVTQQRGPETQVSAIIDFGLADRTNAVHDLATAIERNAVEWLRLTESRAPAATIVHYDQIDALLAGYVETKPLTPAERRALAAMLPLVHCEFALSETDYFLSVLHDPARAYLGYEGYFLGHAAWFHTNDGAALLKHLRQWADSESHEEERT